MEGRFKENGWCLSAEGITECEKTCNKERATFNDCLRAALNLDLRQYGMKNLPEDINRGKLVEIKGPVVLQVQKTRNVSAPKANEDSNHAPRLLKLQLTDGHTNCHALELDSIPQLSLSTPPGTKVCLSGSIPVHNGFLSLNSNNTKVLGGKVEKMVTKWELNKNLAKHSRLVTSTEGGPPPFVPFGQGKNLPNERLKATDRARVNGQLPNSSDKPSVKNNQESNVHATKPKLTEATSNKEPRHDAEELGSRSERSTWTNSTQRDPKREPSKSNIDRGNHRQYSEGRPSGHHGSENRGPLSDSQRRGRVTRRGGTRGETRHGHELSVGENEQNSRGERNTGDRHEQMQESFQGGGRGSRSRFGRREPQGRGRAGVAGVYEEGDAYSSRQPFEGTLWDFLESKLPVSKDQQKKQNLPASNVIPCNDKPTRQETPGHNRNEQSRSEERSRRTIKNQDDGHQRVESRADREKTKEREQSGREGSPRARENRQSSLQHPNQQQQQQEQEQQQQQQNQHQQQNQRQQNSGYGRGKGQKGRYEDIRQSLPPRLQKKQQQQRQQQHQQQQQLNTAETYHGNKSNLPPELSKNSQSSVEVKERENIDKENQESHQNRPSNKSTREHTSRSKRQRNNQRQKQTLEHTDTKRWLEGKEEGMDAKENTQEDLVNSPNGTPELSAHYTADPTVQNAGEVFATTGYPHQGATQAAVQHYPVYQVQPAQAAQLQPTAQQQIMQPAQAVPAQMTTAQVPWKKGDQCLAMWRDGQCYSAKIEEIQPGAPNCLVSFMDFHNSWEVIPLASLRAFPIIAWGEGNITPPSQPGAAIAAMPYYAQPTPLNAMPRQQVIIPVQSSQPPFHADPRTIVAHSAPVPTQQVQWQPAQLQYQDDRPQTFQPMVQYGTVPQASVPVPRAVYRVPPAGGVRFVRGVKELQGKELVNSSIHIVGSGDGNQTTGGNPHHGGQRKPRQRPTQAFYIPPAEASVNDKKG